MLLGKYLHSECLCLCQNSVGFGPDLIEHLQKTTEKSESRAAVLCSHKQ